MFFMILILVFLNLVIFILKFGICLGFWLVGVENFFFGIIGLLLENRLGDLDCLNFIFSLLCVFLFFM